MRGRILTMMIGGSAGPDRGDASFSNAADGCPLWGLNRTPWVQRGIDANDPFRKWRAVR
jgi:hypothetical protein